MKLTLFTLAMSVALALAAPTQQTQSAPPAGPASCKFSANERLNLGHNHDVNTGKIRYETKEGFKVSGKAPQIGGSGCSPAWANGGNIKDNTPQKTRMGCTRGKECGAA
jgi:hypothetical protein